MLDSTGLRVMKAIADHGSFTAAANALGSSQPAISQMVRRLEQRTGTVLVERTGRSVRLTEAGAALARHAAPVMAALDEAEEEVAAIVGLRTGRVRLMAFPSSSATLVPRALAAVRKAHPNITVSFTEAEPPQSIAALRAGECDIAVAFSYAGSTAAAEEDLEGLVVSQVIEDEVRVALPTNHPAARQPTVDLADLADEEWIAGCPRCRGHLLQLANGAGFVPSVMFETEDFVAVQGFVAAGLGVALIPDLIRASQPNENVAIRPLAQSSRRTISVVTTPDLERVPSVEATLKALCASARQIEAGPGA